MSRPKSVPSALPSNKDEDDDDSIFESHQSFYDDIDSDLDEEIEEVKHEINKKRRFGFKVRKQFKIKSNFVRILGIVFLIMLIPMQVFLETVLQETENGYIADIQNELSPNGTTVAGSWIIPFYNIVEESAQQRIVLLICLILYLSTDTLLAFKSATLYCIGQYIFIIMSILYQSPRPFWNSAEIHAYPNYCYFDLASPSLAIFNAVFFINYNIHMYFYKYTPIVYLPVVIGLYTLSLLYFIILASAMRTHGLLYLFQIVVSTLFSLVYLLICIKFDNEIYKLCEKVGFIVKASRKFKFYQLFATVIAFLFGTVIVNSQRYDWEAQQNWILHAAQNPKVCYENLYVQNAGNLGMNATWDNSCILFFLTGMGFGCSYSLLQVDSIEFVNTTWHKKLLRTSLGVLISLGVYFLMRYSWDTLQTDKPHHQMNRYLVKLALPYFFISLFISGPYVVICQKLNLVGQGTVTKKQQVVSIEQMDTSSQENSVRTSLNDSNVKN